jgi:hypothetical protein
VVVLRLRVEEGGEEWEQARVAVGSDEVDQVDEAVRRIRGVG